MTTPCELVTNAAAVRSILAHVSPPGRPSIVSFGLLTKLCTAVLPVEGPASKSKHGCDAVTIRFSEAEESQLRELRAAVLGMTQSFERLISVLTGSAPLVLPTPQQLRTRERCLLN